MAFSKVTLNGDTLMDVTQKTVIAATMLSGTTALKNDGTDITGNIATKTSANLSASGATVTAPAGYYASDASKSVATGTAGTPTATKGTVSNHAVSVTPSVTNTEGYISGGTKTGTAVSVSASELVSGTKSITASGTTDVTNYASASVAAGSATTPATSITANPTVSVTIGPGKNLLPYENGWYYAVSGLTFNILSDGGVHISGTSSAISGYYCYSNTSSAMNLPVGSYRFLLTGSGTGFDNASIQLYTDTGSGMASRNYNKDFTYTITSSVTADYVRIRCAAGTYDCTVYPMVMDSSNTDTTWEAYAIQAKATASVSASQSITPTVSAGYVSSGTAGTVTVSGSSSNTEQLTTQSAQTIHPSTTDQTIASGTYLTGTQTIKAVTTTNLTAANIVSGVTVKIGDSTDDDCVASVTGTHSGGGGGLEYEEGTWTPTADIARATISFQRTHSEMPIHVILSDISSKDTLIENSCTFWCYDDPYLISGYPFPLNASSAVRCYSISQWVYSTSSSYGAGRIYCTYPSSSTSDSSSSFPRYWVTETGFYPYSNSASRYFRAGRSYKWIAVWAPTT